MRNLFALVVACMVVVPVAAETGFTGTWSTPKKAQPSMVMEFNVAGTTLTGTIRAVEGTDPAIVMAVTDGKVVGNRVTFKTVVPDATYGPYPMMFSGHRTGDTIKFKCDVEVNPPDAAVVLGPACVRSVTVRRSR
jgi:hypothetical protein